MRIWQKFKFGIFDVDGTIFDNMALCADAFLEIVKKYNLPEKEVRKIYLETNGMNLNDQLKLVFRKCGVKYDSALIEKLNKSFFNLRDNSKEWQNAPLFPEIKILLAKLKQNGVKTFISSGSNTAEVEFRLKKSGILRYFALALGAEKIPKGVGHFEEFARYCGVSKKEFFKNAFLLSDGPNDMELAKKAGIFAVGITNTVNAEKLKSVGADIVISKAEELADIDF